MHLTAVITFFYHDLLFPHNRLCHQQNILLDAGDRAANVKKHPIAFQIRARPEVVGNARLFQQVKRQFARVNDSFTFFGVIPEKRIGLLIVILETDGQETNVVEKLQVGLKFGTERGLRFFFRVGGLSS